MGFTEYVDVARGAPLEPAAPHTPRWPELVAATATLAVIGTTTALVALEQGMKGPSGDDATVAVRTVPTVFPMPGDVAQDQLEREGFDVSVEEDATCTTPGRASRTEPAAGTRVASGSRVVLYVTASPVDARCAEPVATNLAWQLLDFVNGFGPAPAFAPSVSDYTNGVRDGLIDAQAEDRLGLGVSALGVFSRDSWRLAAGAPPTLGVPDPASSFVCTTLDLPAQLRTREAVAFWIAFPDGRCSQLDVFLTGGRIDALVLRTTTLPAGTGTEVPLLIGLSVDDARSLARELGLGFGSVCGDGNVVLDQQPIALGVVSPGTTVTVEAAGCAR